MPRSRPFHEQFAEDLQRGIEAFRAMSPEAQRQWLIEHEYITPDGRLHPQYDHQPSAETQTRSAK